MVLGFPLGNVLGSEALERETPKDSAGLTNLLIFFKILFIYEKYREREAEGEAGSMQEA